jgi:hypothetical protein
MANGLEIIAAPFDVYLAPYGTAMPAINAAPAGNWFKLGSAGSKNYDESGVKVMHDQKIDLVHTLGRTGAAKALRSQEGTKIVFTLLDLTLEQYRKVLNDVAVSVVNAASGVPGSKRIPIRRGLSVAEYALLVKGAVSPEGSGWSMQYELPRGYVDGSPDVVFVKNKAAGLQFTIAALEDYNAVDGEEFGVLRVQSADALP